METLHTLNNGLPSASTSTTDSSPSRSAPLRSHSQLPLPPDRRVSLPSISSLKTLRKSYLFSQTPQNGPAIMAPSTPTSNTNPSTPPTKRCETSLNPSLYLAKTPENFYGRFITLGYHSTSGPLSDPLLHRSERNKSFELWKRVRGNAFKFDVDSESGLRATKVVSSQVRERLRTMSIRMDEEERQRSGSIRVTTLERPDRLVEYKLVRDAESDLFQFGRDPYNNDFHIPGHTVERHTWDPISRLAFRVQCNRNTKVLKISAAGFDYANEIFLGPYALRWNTLQSEGNGAPLHMDGGITVGLHLWKPSNEEKTQGDWYEVSALGEVYHLRQGGKRGRKAEGVDNTLTDGCIVVNATSVLLFTTIPPADDGKYLTPETLQEKLEGITNTLCPITFDPLPLRNAMISNAGFPNRPPPISPSLLPSHSPSSSLSTYPLFNIPEYHSPPQQTSPRPTPPRSSTHPSFSPVPESPETPEDIPSEIPRVGVFPSCGHVFIVPPPQYNQLLTKCPKCRQAGSMIPLLCQTAPTFLTPSETFTHVLPCGHAVSEHLAQRMKAVALPTNDVLSGEFVNGGLAFGGAWGRDKLIGREGEEWASLLVGRRRRCWFCGAGFYPGEVQKLYFEVQDEVN